MKKNKSLPVRETTKEEWQKELELDPNYKERPLEPDWRPMQQSIDRLVIERDALKKENLELKYRFEKLLDNGIELSDEQEKVLKGNL